MNAKNILPFTEKYIDYFLTRFQPESQAYYEFFDSETFPNECRDLGFEMDCGKSFIEAYGGEAWRSYEELSKIIGNVNDLKILGSALFSQWRYFNHWAYGHAKEEDKQWFLIILRHMKEIANKN